MSMGLIFERGLNRAVEIAKLATPEAEPASPASIDTTEVSVDERRGHLLLALGLIEYPTLTYDIVDSRARAIKDIFETEQAAVEVDATMALLDEQLDEPGADEARALKTAQELLGIVAQTS